MGQAWRIRVYNNARYMDEDEAYDLRETFADKDEAVSRAKALVDEGLRSLRARGDVADDLVDAYRMWGEDPVVLGPEPSGFSAWTYAEQQAQAV